MLFRLPTEILIMICKRFRETDDWRTLHALSRVCAGLRSVVLDTCGYKEFFKAGEVYIATHRYSYQAPEYVRCEGFLDDGVYFSRLRSERILDQLLLVTPHTVIDDAAVDLPLVKIARRDSRWHVDGGCDCPYSSFLAYTPGSEPELPPRRHTEMPPGCLIA